MISRSPTWSRILNTSLILFVVSISASLLAQDRMPADFHWVDFKREAATVSKIAKSLEDENYTAIREILLGDTFALVVVVRREDWQTVPDGDQSSLFSVGLRDKSVAALLSGYNVQIKTWVGFQSGEKRELVITYFDCSECEPTSLITAIHYEHNKGWRGALA